MAHAFDSETGAMGLLSRFFLLLIASGALLLGIQVPGFVDQYQKRVDAHFQEVSTNLKPFQEIADRLHGGSIVALIEKHEQSSDATFHAEGDAIRKMHDRFLRFQNEKIQLQAALPQQLVWMATGADRELLLETRRNYSFGILLDRTALIAGFSCMIVVVIVLELLASLFRLGEPARTRAR